MFTTFLAILIMVIFCSFFIVPEIREDERKRQEEEKEYNRLNVFLNNFNKIHKEEKRQKD